MSYRLQDDVCVLRSKLLAMECFTERTMSKFTVDHPEARTDSGYPLMRVVSDLNQDCIKMRMTIAQLRAKYEQQGRAVNLEDPLADLTRAKQFEEVQKLRILNQTKMGSLISRSRAKSRILTLLSAFASKLRYTIKHTATQIAGLNDARQVEKILTQNYNDVLDMLESEAKLVSWSEDGINSELGRTDLPENSGENISAGSVQENKVTP